MGLRPRELPALLATPLGRRQAVKKLYVASWPVMRRVAGLYRRTVVRKVPLVAVVGSLGKTTTVRAVSAALGVPIHRRYFANAWTAVSNAVLRLRPGDRAAVIEAGIDHTGQMVQYARLLRPDAVVVTSIGSEHHRWLGDLETTRREKAEMVRALRLGGVAILNGDDPNVMWMREETEAPVMTFGLGPSCDVRAEGIAIDWPLGTRFRLLAAGEDREVRVRLVGRHMVYSVLAAVATGLRMGRDLDEIVSALEEMAPAHGRLETVPLESGAWVLRDDFKSTWESIKAAFEVMEEIPAARRFAVVGDIYEPPVSQDRLYREIGRRLAGFATAAIVFGPHDRRFVAEAVRAGMPRDALFEAGDDLGAVCDELRRRLGPGDVVLIKGCFAHLDRITFALQGRQVRCEIASCMSHDGCDRCPMLERGWSGRRVVMLDI